MKNRYKKYLIAFILVICLLAVPTVSAFDSSCTFAQRFNESTIPSQDFCGIINDEGHFVGSITTGVTGISKDDGDWGSGLAFDFTGNDNYINVSSSSEVTPSGNFSYGTWFKVSSSELHSDSYPRLMSTFNFDNKKGYAIGIEGSLSGSNSANSLYCDTYIEGNKVSILDEGTDVADDNWHHGVCTVDFSSNELRLYLDGNLLSTTSFTGNSFSHSEKPLGIGYGPVDDAHEYNGAIDEPRIWTESVNTNETSNVYSYNSLNNLTAPELYNTSITCSKLNNNRTKLECSWSGVDNTDYTELRVNGDLVANTSKSSHTVDKLVPQLYYTVNATYHNSTVSTSDEIVSDTADWNLPLTPELNASSKGVSSVKDTDFLTYGNDTIKLYNGRGVIAASIYNNSEWSTALFRSNNDSLQSWSHWYTVPNSAAFNAPDLTYWNQTNSYYLVAQDYSQNDGFADLSYENKSSPADFDWVDSTVFYTDADTECSSSSGVVDWSIQYNGTHWVAVYGQGEYCSAVSSRSPVSGFTETNSNVSITTDFVEGIELLDGFTGFSSYLGIVVDHGNPDDETSLIDFSNDLASNTEVNDNWLGTGSSGSWDESGRGHGDWAWYRNGMVLSYQGFESGDTVETGADTAVLRSTNFESIVDTTPPSLDIISPLNQTYSTDTIDLNVTSSEPANYTVNTEYRNGTQVSSNTTYTENDQDLNITLSNLPDGYLTVNVWATDSAGNTRYASQNFAVNVNQPPSITNYTLTPSPIYQDDQATATATISDVDDTTLNATFTWTVNQTQIRSNTLTSLSNDTLVTDSLQSTNYYSFDNISVDLKVDDGKETTTKTITTQISNEDPQLTKPTFNDSSVDHNESVSASTDVSDLEGNTYNITGRWYNTTTQLTSETRTIRTPPKTETFALDPSNYEANNTISFNATVSDLNATTSSKTSTFTVNDPDANQAPVLNSISNKTSEANTEISVDADASDHDEDPISYDINTSKGSIDTSTGEWTWTPNSSQLGNYTFQFIATDTQSNTDTEIFQVTVNQETTNSGGGGGGGGGGSNVIGSGTQSINITPKNTSRFKNIGYGFGQEITVQNTLDERQIIQVEVSDETSEEVQSHIALPNGEQTSEIGLQPKGGFGEQTEYEYTIPSNANLTEGNYTVQILFSGQNGYTEQHTTQLQVTDETPITPTSPIGLALIVIGIIAFSVGTYFVATAPEQTGF